MDPNRPIHEWVAKAKHNMRTPMTVIVSIRSGPAFHTVDVKMRSPGWNLKKVRDQSPAATKAQPVMIC